MTQVVARTETYVLGHSPEELYRLDAQGAILRPYTERLLRDAGIGPGMRVLDAGCGTGDATVLAAELVGPSGAVIGIDRSPEALATARARAEAHSLPQLRFREGDVASDADPDSFDAVVGRLILGHQSDPAAVLRHLANQVPPGGIVAFAEALTPSPALGWPARPLLQQTVTWVVDTMRRSGMQNDMGLRLHAIFVEVGLPAPRLRLDGVVVAGADRARLAWLVGTLRSVMPAAERSGVATAAEIGIETLLDRLLEEATEFGGAGCGFFLGGAWVRKPVH